MNRIRFVVYSLAVSLAAFSGPAYGQTLADALDQPTWTFSTNVAAGWSGQTAATHDGTDAAQSGAIADGQNSTIETTHDFPEDGYVTFFWKISSEEGWDQLSFIVDDVVHELISGEVDWQLLRFRVDGGVHTLKWVFGKDRGCCSGGADAAWVDQLEFMPATQVHSLMVKSTNPASGVSVGVSPADDNGDRDGTTPFTRTYPAGSWVVVEAPRSAGQYTRVSWDRLRLQRGDVVSGRSLRRHDGDGELPAGRKPVRTSQREWRDRTRRCGG